MPEVGWYPVALSEGLERGTSTGTRLFGRELVVWRDSDGIAHIWEDRCPHRGMRLSFGFVRGDRIACLYHGWNYDAAGQCRYIPAHPQLTPPQSIKVEVYPSAERMGMVWVTGGDAEALPGDLPVVPVRSLHVECSFEIALGRLRAETLPRLAAQAESPTLWSLLAPRLVSVTNGVDRLLIGIQPITVTDTTLHIAIAGGSTYRGAGQRHFSDWAENVRAALERPSENPVGLAS